MRNMAVMDGTVPALEEDEKDQNQIKISVSDDRNDQGTLAPLIAGDKVGRKNSRFKVEFVNEARKSPPDGSTPETLSGSPSAEEGTPLTPASPRDEYEHSYMGRTFGQNTLEAVPSIGYYRNLFSTTADAKSRPTLLELHGNFQEDDTQEDDSSSNHRQVGPSGSSGTAGALKFGWIKGVLVRCLLNIWGVMLFLRLSWVVGQAGIGLSTVIILVSSVVTISTTLSMSAICTNGQVKGGGAYFMISRSLGPEFGGSIGLIFSMANAIAVALYVVGFAETVVDIMQDSGVQMVDQINDVRIIGAITVVLLLGITMVGMAWEARAQLILLCILIVAIIDFVIGTFIPPPQTDQAKGFLGYKASVFNENFGQGFEKGESFFSVFSIFFPAATGILAGANISGDLTDPQKAIPKGTLLAILLSTITYIGMAWMMGSCTLRAATGSVDDLVAGNFTNCSFADCQYGLVKDFQVVEMIAGWGPIIYAGIFAATLSSALASLVGAPKVFQAVCIDKIFPKIEYFAKGVGPSNEPRRAYILTFVIGLGFILIGELNAIAPIISNFFLMSYTLINFSCFSASLAKSPGWRPAFKYYNKWVALAASLLCLAIMFLINWWAALLTIIIVTSLYLYVRFSKPEINWGSSTQAYVYVQALQATLKLNGITEHVKNFRPQCLVLTGPPNCRPALARLTSQITKNSSLMVCGHIITGPQEKNTATLMSETQSKWLQKEKIKAFYSVTCATSLRSGIQSLLQITGLGKLKPNTVMMGYKSNWQHEEYDQVQDYVNIIHDCFDLHFGVGILRVQEGIDVSAALSQDRDQDAPVRNLTSQGDHSFQFIPNTESSTVLRFSVKAGSSVCIGLCTDDKESAILYEIVLGAEENSTSWISLKNSAINDSEITLVSTKNLLSADQFKPFWISWADGYLQVGEGTEVLNPEKLLLTRQSQHQIHVRFAAFCTTDGAIGNFIKIYFSYAVPSPSRSNSEASNLLTEKTGDTWNSAKNSANDRVVSSTKRIKKEPIKEVIKSIFLFKEKQGKGTIDVWWLFDDGGLTLLLPYLLSQRSQWENCRLRVFASGKKDQMDKDKRNMASMLNKFRIDYSSVEIIPDINKKPNSHSLKAFDELVLPWILQEDEKPEDYLWKILKDDMDMLKEKTHRQIRLGELLRERSSSAALIVMSLPMPRKGTCPAYLYMSWLETLSKDLPPLLLLRGNQMSVLTFYS